MSPHPDQPVAEELDRLNDAIEDLRRRVAALEDPATIQKMLVRSIARQRNWSAL